MAGVLGFCLSLIILTADFFNTNALGGESCGQIKEKAKRLIILGDSHFYGGAEFDKVCFQSFVKEPCGQTMEGGPARSGKFSDGPIIPDYIAQYLFEADAKVVAYNDSNPEIFKEEAKKAKSLSFAMAGAGVAGSAPSLEGRTDIKTRTLQKQVDLLVQNKVSFDLMGKPEDVLYLISIGTEDYLKGVKKIDQTLDEQSVSIKVIDAAEEVTKGIKDAVERIRTELEGKRFAFLNVADLSVLPVVHKVYGKEYNKQKYLGRLAAEHFTKLSSKMEESGVEYSILQYHDLLTKWIDKADTCAHYDPKTVQLACCEESCCDEPSLYVFWDARHNTQHINHELAHQFWSGGSNSVVYPQNLKKLAGSAKPIYTFDTNAI